MAQTKAVSNPRTATALCRRLRQHEGQVLCNLWGEWEAHGAVSIPRAFTVQLDSGPVLSYEREHGRFHCVDVRVSRPATDGGVTSSMLDLKVDTIADDAIRSISSRMGPAEAGAFDFDPFVPSDDALRGTVNKVMRPAGRPALTDDHYARFADDYNRAYRDATGTPTERRAAVRDASSLTRRTFYRYRREAIARGLIDED